MQNASKAFGRTPESWLQIQMQYDLAQVSQRVNLAQIKPFVVSTDAVAAVGGEQHSASEDLTIRRT